MTPQPGRPATARLLLDRDESGGGAAHRRFDAARRQVRERVLPGTPVALIGDAIGETARPFDPDARAALWLYGWHCAAAPQPAVRSGRFDRWPGPVSE